MTHAVKVDKRDAQPTSGIGEASAEVGPALRLAWSLFKIVFDAIQ